MNSKTKIVVLRMKELIYTGIFVLLGILLILLLVTMFAPGRKEKDTVAVVEEPALYQPGIYTSSIVLGGNSIDLEVTVEKDYIASIRLVNLNESVTTMYPLMEPALENLTTQIYSVQSLDHITYPEENQYTSMVILDAIKTALDKARLSESETTGTENDRENNGSENSGSKSTSSENKDAAGTDSGKENSENSTSENSGSGSESSKDEDSKSTSKP